MERTRLILLEGIPGSGKTTMARRVHEWLTGRGVPVSLHAEGDARHPINLAWHAYFPADEYRRFAKAHPRAADYAVLESDYALVQYRDMYNDYFDGDARRILEAREFCYTDQPAVPLEVFTAVVRRRWERFAQDARGISILDASFLQHPLHDMLRMYQPGDEALYAHIASVSECVERMEPVLFYIAQCRVEDSLRRIAELRGKPQFANEDSILFWQRRKTIEYSLMSRLPIRSYILDNSDYNWERVFALISGILDP